MLLENKVIIITGSTTGIGRAIAERAVNEGASVIVHGRNKERAEQLCQQLGSKASFVVADLDDPHVGELLVNAAVETFGRLDGVVNNAGIYPRTTIDDVDHDIFHDIMSINVKAPLMLCREAVKQYRRQKSAGSIVNIGSINAHCGQPDLLLYSMSKGALMTMTRNLADAHGCEGIRFNQLNVGWTATENEIALKQREGLPQNWQQQIPAMYAPQGRILTPQDIAPHAIFWLSEHSAPSNGVVYELEQYPLIGRNRICDITLT